MKITIAFGGPLKNKIGEFRSIEVQGKDCIDLEEFRSCLQSQEWSKEILEDGYIVSPVILIIDEQLVQFSQNNNIKITATSKIQFQVMFAGG